MKRVEITCGITRRINMYLLVTILIIDRVSSVESLMSADFSDEFIRLLHDGIAIPYFYAAW